MRGMLCSSAFLFAFNRGKKLQQQKKNFNKKAADYLKIVGEKFM